MRKTAIYLLMCCLVFCSNVWGEDDIAAKGSLLNSLFQAAVKPVEILLSPSLRLDPIVVTAARYKKQVSDVSGNVTLIDTDEIKRSGAKYVPDVLRKKAGIVISDYLGNGKTLQVDMRGYGGAAPSNVLVLVDGRRTNQVDISGVDWTQIDVDAIDRIEITRGPQTVLYGDNATGGVINIITKKGAYTKPEIGYKYEAGSYKYQAHKVFISGSSEFLDYHAMAATSYNYGHRVNSHLETVDYSAGFKIKPDDYIICDVSFGYHRDWYGMPGAVKPVDINSVGRSGSIYPNNKARTEDFFFMASPEVDINTDFGDFLITIDLLTRGRRTDSIFYSSWGDSATSHHIRTFGIAPKAAFVRDIFGAENRFIAGVDYYDNRDEISSGLLSAVDMINIDKNTLGAYVTDAVELPCSVIIDAGFRGEWAHYVFDQESQLPDKSSEKPFEYAYNAGINYKYSEKSSVYFDYSRSFRFPATDEYYQSLYTDWLSGLIAGGLNTDLKPQVAHNYEIGVKDNTFSFMSINADYFLSDVKHELYYDSTNNQNSIYDHTIHHGAELEADFYFYENFNPFFNYTYTKAFFVGGSFAGNEIPLVPRHKISAGFNYVFMDTVYFSYTVNYTGKRYFINDLQNIQPKMKTHMTHDVRASYEKYGLEMFISVNNIFDEIYSEYGVLDFLLTNPGIYPSPRRNFTAGVSYKF